AHRGRAALPPRLALHHRGRNHRHPRCRTERIRQNGALTRGGRYIAGIIRKISSPGVTAISLLIGETDAASGSARKRNVVMPKTRYDGSLKRSFDTDTTRPIRIRCPLSRTT